MDTDLFAWLGFWLWGWGLGFTLYVLAQLVALGRLRGAARLWSVLPLPFMAWVLYLTLNLYADESNIWPVFLITASPVALIYVLLVLLIAISLERTRQKADKLKA